MYKPRYHLKVRRPTAFLHFLESLGNIDSHSLEPVLWSYTGPPRRWFILEGRPLYDKSVKFLREKRISFDEWR